MIQFLNKLQSNCVEIFARLDDTVIVVSLSVTSPMGPQRSCDAQSFTNAFQLALEMTTRMGCLICPPVTMDHRH
jgi:hypothetical protein